MKKDKNLPADLVWDMFTQTGEYGYYMLYKNLKEKDEG